MEYLEDDKSSFEYHGFILKKSFVGESAAASEEQ